MKKIYLMLTLALTFLYSAIALAQEVVQPGLDELGGSLIELAKNWKTLGTLGILIAILNLLIMLLKSKYCKGWFGKQSALIKRTLIVILGQAVAILALVSGGASWVAAILAGLVTSGGAITVYEVLKPLFNKKEEVVEVDSSK